MEFNMVADVMVSTFNLQPAQPTTCWLVIHFSTRYLGEWLPLQAAFLWLKEGTWGLDQNLRFLPAQVLVCL